MELTRLGKYEIVAKIGEGGMGEVYRAHDPVLGRDVAIKIMSAGGDADQELRRRFLREARSAARLNHPNIVTVHDFGEDQGKLFIAMELLEGTDLREIIANRTPLTLPVKFSLLSQVSEGLAFAHQQDIVHRDIKPGNIHVQRHGHIKVMDFGLARGSTPDMTLAGSILGTPNYMSPEQVRGEPATRRSDVFALGVVFYELLTGHKAFDANSMAGVVYQVMSVEPTPVEAHDRTLPPGLSALIVKAMAKDPADRYADAGELLASLREIETLARSSLEELISKAPPGRGGSSTPWPVPPRHTPLPRTPEPPTVLTATPAAGPSEALDRTIQGDHPAYAGETLRALNEVETLARPSPVEMISKAPPGRAVPPEASPVPPPARSKAPISPARPAAPSASPDLVLSEAPTLPERPVAGTLTEILAPAPAPLSRRPTRVAPAPSKVPTAWIATGVGAAIVAIVAGPSVWQRLRPEAQVTMTPIESSVSPTPLLPLSTPAPAPTMAPNIPVPVAPAESAAVTAAVREIRVALSARDEARAARGLRTLAAFAPGHREFGELSKRANELKTLLADEARRATERAQLERAPTPLPTAVLTVPPTPMATAAPILSPTPPPVATAMPTLAPPGPPIQGEAAARQAIRGVLDEFRAAFERRDVEALRAVQPGVNYEQMKTMFATVSSYLVRIDVKDVSVQGDVARARCSVTYSPVPKPAGKQKPVAQVFHLRRKGDLWIIERIEAE